MTRSARGALATCVAAAWWAWSATGRAAEPVPAGTPGLAPTMAPPAAQPAAAAPAPAVGAAPLQAPGDPRSGAWEWSVALERAGHTEQALHVLLRAWGPASDSYEVTVRLAWLSLRLGRADDAVRLYRRAWAMSGAGPEAGQGLVSALTMLGFAQVERGERDGATDSFEQALRIDPGAVDARRGKSLAARRAHFEPEVWNAYVRKDTEGNAWTGWAMFAHLPWHVTDEITVRAAYRHVQISRTTTLPAPIVPPWIPQPAGTDVPQQWHDNEVYGLAGIERRWFGVEMMGAALYPSDEAAAGLVAGRARVGRTVGGHVELSAIGRERGWNVQVFPTAFYWPADSVGLAAGARITHEPRATMVSGFGGLTVRAAPVTLLASGHVGKERWPVSLAVPSVLALTEDLLYGAEAAIVVGVTEEVGLGLHGLIEKVEGTSARGTYGALGVGLKVAPRF